MSRKGKDDNYDDEDYYYSTDEDVDEYDGGVSDDDAAEAKDLVKGYDLETDDDDADQEVYDFETVDDVRRCQDEVTATISDLLSIPRGFAAAFLRHCRWDPEHLQNEWFSDEGRRIRAAVGLTAGRPVVPAALNDGPLTCAICFDLYGPGEMRSAGCYYCHVAVRDGSRCLLLRCPDPSCPVPVVRELVDEVATDEDRARYAKFVVRSFVEEGTSKYVRWCPGPGCTLAVRSRPGSVAYEVACAGCKHVFCFRCGEDAHRPASCDTARAWVDKCRADGETSSWVLANTKHYPECRRAIEKNQGCNHMTCGAPCYHEFCWLCLGSWWEDHAGDAFHCNVYEANPSEFSGEATRREQAKASLERFVHYYERWCAHGASMEKARQDMDALQGGGLDRLAGDMGVPATEMGFLLDAYVRIVEARRVLRWTYAHVYHMDPARDKLELCEYLQGEAEGSLERLHHCAEREREELREDLGEYGTGFPAGYGARRFDEFREKLCNLNRNHFSKVVEGFESGMPEKMLDLCTNSKLNTRKARRIRGAQAFSSLAAERTTFSRP